MVEPLPKRRCSNSSSGDTGRSRKSPKRQATLFDAVAGRVSSSGFIAPYPVQINKNRDTGLTSFAPLKPDEVLFKRQNAPERFAEIDYYFANTYLSQRSTLPSADLLSCLHAYISKHYTSTVGRSSRQIWKSMDETALLAFGILLEEAARESLGDAGDMIFVEAQEECSSPRKTVIEVAQPNSSSQINE